MARTNKKLVTAFTHDPKAEICFEPVGGEELVVKGEAYTINELFARHLSGSLGKEFDRGGFYAEMETFDAVDFSKLADLDIFDRAQVYEEVQTRARIALKKIEDYEKSQAEIEAETDAAIEKAEAEDPSNPANQGDE